MEKSGLIILYIAIGSEVMDNIEVLAFLVGAEHDGLHIVVYLSNGRQEESIVPWDALRAMMEFLRNGD